MVSKILLKRPKQLRAQLRRELAALRRAYKIAVISGEPGLPEWLRDNYYLLEREGRSAAKELALSLSLPVTAAGLPKIYIACLKIARIGGDETEQNIRAVLSRYPEPFFTRELESIVIMLRVSYIHLAADAVLKNRPESVGAIGSAVSGIRTLSAVDLEEIIEEFSLTEQILSRDPAGIYAKMDEATRSMYRRECARLSAREGIDEALAAQTIVANAENGTTELTRHVGHWLLGKGKTDYRRKVGIAFLTLRVLLPAFPAIGLAILTGVWWLGFLVYLPLYEVARPVLDSVVGRNITTEMLPRLELFGQIPASAPTVTVTSILLPSPDKAAETVKAFERLVYTNGQGTIKFCILADMKESKSPSGPEDSLALESMRREVVKLNKRHGDKFILAVRPRVKVETQNAFAGRERKRGAISDLAAFIRGENARFLLLEGDTSFLRTVKYMLALDADTELLMDAAVGLVSAALHPLNTPQINPKTGTVTGGYGIIAPKIGADLENAGQTAFSRVTSGAGGTTSYSTLSGELYQDCFGESIFAGKGLIDVEAYHTCTRNAFPKERVLSHDFLEGALLRTGFMSDIEVTDGCPKNMSAWLSRQHRWIRGDWQNAAWLPRHSLSPLHKFMLTDSLRRHITPITALACLLAGLALPRHSSLLVVVALASAAFPPLFAAVSSLFSGGLQMLSRKFYSRVMPTALLSLCQAALWAVFLVQTAWIALDALCRTVWRLLVSKKRLLQWVTAADTERANSGLWGALVRTLPSVIIGTVLLFEKGSPARLAGILAILAPPAVYFTGRSPKKTTSRLSISESDRLKAYAAAMWRFYDELCGRGDNFLPPDNMQESPLHKVAHRTSPTNIGLMLLCTLSARDFGFIDSQSLYDRLDRSLLTIEKLEKWHGNLLNWYDTTTLRPLFPRYVSTVDSGNFACCLAALEQGILDYAVECPELSRLSARIKAFREDTDLSVFYDRRRKLFHIGYDLETQKLSNSYYDLFMSESRMTGYYAVASRQVPKKHWGAPGRTLAREGSYTGPVSWTGTMFEYFMPHLLMPVYENSLTFEALRFCVYCQRKRGAERNRPWGCSESGFYAFDPAYNYQYKAHGVQKLGLKRRLNTEYVVSPYSSFLTLSIIPRSSLKNLLRLEKLDMLGRYGFFEAVDFTKPRVGLQGYSTVRSYMAHHVGMSMLSVCNALTNSVMQRRFMRGGFLGAADELLQEKVPAGAGVFRDIILRDVPEKPGRASSQIEEYKELSPAAPRVHLLSNGEYSLILTDSGSGVSMCQGLDITRRSEDILRRPAGVFAAVYTKDEAFFITRAPDYRKNAEYRTEFAAGYAAFYAKSGSLEAGMQAAVHPRLKCEQRRLIIKNRAGAAQTAGLLIYLEPALSRPADDAAHPAFSRLFLVDSYDEDTSSVVFTRRSRDDEPQI
ncbi:MAG: hypothetical protein LBQ48_02710, partial [Oscillospiraceae bacterium]|nr:hypothetical protein [Oscillospiraceae bacterium]